MLNGTTLSPVCTDATVVRRTWTTLPIHRV